MTSESENTESENSYFDTESYVSAQMEEALKSPDNRYYTYITLQRKESDKEALNHWMTHSGPENFAKEHRSKFFKKK